MDELMNPTTGALGTEKRRKYKSKDDKKDDKKRNRIDRSVPQNAPSTHAVKPAYDEAPEPPKSNLAGQPGSYVRSIEGVKKISTKVVGPYHTANLNTESYLHFVIRSTSHEWIRLKRDSITMVIYVTHRNPNYDANSNVAKTATEYWAATAQDVEPQICIDPDVLGTGFFSRVEVVVNRAPVPTNGAIGDLLQQYVRCNNIYKKTEKAKPHFYVQSQISFAKIAEPQMQAATRPFHYGSWNSRDGARVPVYLDGIFPFQLKSPMIQALEKAPEEKLYLPPETELEIKLFFHRTKIESIWHNEMDANKYWNGGVAVGAPVKMKMNIQEASLEYESVELLPQQHVALLEKFKNNGSAVYEYDVARGQHQALTAQVSSCDNTFQIMPYARLLVIMFLPDWAAIIMEQKRRPLSGYSSFPENCSRIRLEYAGETNWITQEPFERFGMRGEQHQLSKKIYYEYLVANRLTSAKFEDLFPQSENERSLIQSFIVDVRSHMSDKMQLLTVKCEFAAGNTSPKDTQVCVISVHPNGRAQVKNVGKTNYAWEWEFLQGV